jgi:hypothetical protein
MKKYLEYLGVISATCALISGAAAFSWKTWGVPEINKQVSVIKYQTNLNTYIIMESITDSTYALRQRKFNQINGIGRERPQK